MLMMIVALTVVTSSVTPSHAATFVEGMVMLAKMTLSPRLSVWIVYTQFGCADEDSQRLSNNEVVLVDKRMSACGLCSLGTSALMTQLASTPIVCSWVSTASNMDEWIESIGSERTCVHSPSRSVWRKRLCGWLGARPSRESRKARAVVEGCTLMSSPSSPCLQRARESR
eukprot:jgi/Chrpa1/2810/Chrysochromulina_OHIO_Genome00012113-RA